MNEISFGMKDKVVLVTGGSRGIGLEIARSLLKENAKVIICGRKQEGLDSAVSELGGSENLMTVQCHIAKEDEVNSMFDSVISRYSKLDVLINNVGMNIVTPSLSDTDPGVWNKIIDSNLNGTFMCSRKAAQIMKNQKSGKVVTISSIAGRKAAPGMGVYGIAKAAIEMMTKVLASELALFNIQVNAVAPSMVKTDFSKPFWSNSDILNEIEKNIPMGRIAEIKDIVSPVLFLSSDAASYITGQTLVVDGGSTIV